MDAALGSLTPAPMSGASIADLERSAHDAATVLKLLANEQRLLLLCKLLDGECSVGELSEYVDLAQSATSQHLARLRRQGLLSTRREAQTIYYRLADPDIVRILVTLCDIYGDGRHGAAGGEPGDAASACHSVAERIKR